MSNKIKGKYGEEIAVNYLIKNGCRIIEKNYRFSRYGEIDIIALDGSTLCFIEVKTRSSDKFGTPFEAITKSKLDKIKKSAFFYLQNSKTRYNSYRIDAISVFLTSKENEKEPEIKYVKNIEF